MTLTAVFPSRARIHLPVHWASGLLIDNRMPIGARFPAGEKPAQLVYQFVLIENADAKGSCQEISARTEKELVGPDLGGGVSVGRIPRNRCAVAVQRTKEGFRLDFTSPTDEPPTVRRVASLGAATEDHCAWMRRTYGNRTIDERIASGEQPAWIADTRMVFTFDLWRPSREVAHTYTHLRDFARELAALGVPRGSLFYLTGWCGPFDAWYPAYEPVQELGGRTAFREAMGAVHEAGYHVLAHVHPRDADPYRPGIEKLTHLALRRFPVLPDPVPARKPAHLLVPPPPGSPLPPIEHSHMYMPAPPGEAVPPAPADDPLRGPYWGWPGGGEREWMGFDTGEVPLAELSPAAEGWVFTTVDVPKTCEAVLAIGGLRKARHGIVKVTTNGRSLLSPGGWFVGHDSYEFPFTFQFHPGVNRIEIACYGWPSNEGGASYGPPLGPEGAWYRISQAYHHPTSWTSPKIGMNTDSPEWHEINTRVMAESVAEFGIDGVHVDSTVLWKWDERGFFAALRRSMPPATVIGTEVASAPGLGFFAFSQTRPLVPPVIDGWQPARSDVPWMIASRYQKYYLHLCAATGFVPVGSGCGIDPVKPSLSSEEAASTGRLMEQSAESHVLYTLRVNYRDYGIDAGTLGFLRDRIVRPDRE